jgi:two-component system, chemotaxis family, protein-glutamate methylesterase/glutaminase
MSEPIRVVVVDDSPTQRAHLVALLEEDGDIDVVAEGSTRADAIETVLRTVPDVVTMDLEMPGTLPGDELAGIRAIRTIMASQPVPILVLSIHAEDSESTAPIDALAAGAAEVQPRPQSTGDPSGRSLRERVRVLRGVKVLGRQEPRRAARTAPDGHPVIALGASIGGPPALAAVLSGLRGLPAPMLVVQHIHRDFVHSFTSWLRDNTGLPAEIAQDGGHALPGHVYVAPGGAHLKLASSGRLALEQSPEITHRPSVDELFRSVAANAGEAAVAVLLTGMGEDGADGLMEVRERGGTTIVQNAETSAVYGMPQAAAHAGAAEHVLPLEEIGPAVLKALA